MQELTVLYWRHNDLANVSTETKAFIEGGFVLGPEGALKRKPALQSVSSPCGSRLGDAINHFFAINRYLLLAEHIGIWESDSKGECLNDEEGLRNMLLLAKSFTWFLQTC